MVVVETQQVHGAGITRLCASGLGEWAGGAGVSGAGLSTRPRRAYPSSGVGSGKPGFREWNDDARWALDSMSLNLYCSPS
jgi:hypothetical protein